MCARMSVLWFLVLFIVADLSTERSRCWGGSLSRHEVSINGLVLDAAGTGAAPGQLKARSEKGVRLWVVQFRGPVAEREKQAVQRLGVRLLDYLPEFAFLASMDDSARKKVMGLPFVERVLRYHPGYKMNGKLRKMAIDPTPGEAVTLQLKLDGASSLGEVLGTLRQLGGEPLAVGRDTIRVRVDSRGLSDIAALEEVTWIGEHVDMELFNDTTRWVIQSNVPGNTGIWGQGLHGEGEIVGVGDSGLDYDIPWIRDPSGAQIGETHRKMVGYDTTYGDDYDTDSPGHGTHVCGTLAGDRTPVDGLDSGNGMAPKAKLFLQDLTEGSSSYVYPPDDLGLLFGGAYKAGARLHSDSWGNSDRSYSVFTQSADRYLWEHQDFLVLVANGNAGPSISTVGSPANAKNVISVGASYNGSDAQNMAAFSSNGPTADGRIKPTLVAPGVSIISADSDGLKDSFNSGTRSMSGTSMATPAVAGAAALVRQYFAQGFYPLGTPSPVNAFPPSGALVKAVLMNSAQEMTGSGTAGNIPAIGQGWGRVQLDRVLPLSTAAGRLAVVTGSTGLVTGGTWSGEFLVAGGNPLKATLVWTDYPGGLGAAKALVNDLDLTVTAPDGSRFLGNSFAGGQSVAGGAADRTNVEEQVLIKAPWPGLYTVTVTGYNVPVGPQPFALAVTGVSGGSQRGTIILDRRRYNSSSSVQIQVADTGLDRDHDLVEQVTVTVASSAEPAGEDVVLRETAAGSAIFSGTLRLAPAPARPADGVLQVSNADNITASYHDADDGSGKAATVTATAVVDNVAPVCSGLGVTGTTDTSTTVVWLTDEPAGTSLRYGTTPSLGAETSDRRLLTQHEMALSALQENSTYYLTVTSTDEAGNSATCGTTFATKSLPPALLVTSSVGSVTYRSSTVISGTSTDPSGVASVKVNGIAANYRVSDGYFEVELPLAVGDNLFSVLSSDTLGNTARKDLTVTRLAMGDLLVQYLSGPDSARQGGSITVADTVCNNGPGTALPFEVGFYLSADTAFSPDDRFIGSRGVTNVPAPGSCVSASSTVIIPTSTPGGTYYLVACADYRNAVEETDESNNCRAGNAVSIPMMPINPPASIVVPLSSSTGKFLVSWGSSNVTGASYVLEYSRDGGEWTQVYSGTGTYAYPSLTQNGDYSFRVKAVKSGFADSPYTVSTNTCKVVLACGAPASIVVPVSNSTGKFQVSWGSSNVTGATYVMEYSRNGGGWIQLYSGTGIYSYPNVTQNGDYSFRVKAVKSGFADSPYTVSANACKVFLACGAPGAMVVPVSNSTGKFQVSWGSGSVTGATYVMEYSLNGGGWTQLYSGTGIYAYPSVTQNGDYSFRVKAVKTGYADSPYTVSANVCKVFLACGAPSSVVVPASSSTGKFQVSWGSSNVTGVTYVLEYSRDGGAWTQMYSGGSTYAYFSGSVSGSYRFRVKAVKSGFADSGYTISLPCIVTLSQA